jgi:NAD(P)-dependent dehydrogenase (short-subunit alcohol dehydrogenase family)
MRWADLRQHEENAGSRMSEPARTTARFVADAAARFGGIHTAVYAAGPYINMLLAKGDFDERFLQVTRDTVALRRLGSAREIADAVDFLVSDRATYITGQTLMVDGGFAV